MSEVVDLRVSKDEITSLKNLALTIGNALKTFQPPGAEKSPTHLQWLVLLDILKRAEE